MEIEEGEHEVTLLQGPTIRTQSKKETKTTGAKPVQEEEAGSRRNARSLKI